MKKYPAMVDHLGWRLAQGGCARCAEVTARSCLRQAEAEGPKAADLEKDPYELENLIHSPGHVTVREALEEELGRRLRARPR